MQLRTFIAKDMREALGQVRREMGPDAVIVGSQRAKEGGILVRAALDAANTNEEIAPAGPEPATPEPVAIEPSQDFAQHFHDGLIKRLRGETRPSATVRNFDRAELLGFLRAHRAPETLAHQLAEAAEKSGLSDMTLALASSLDSRMRAEPLTGGETRALLLIGPSGVGKTAVAAKIAAHARLAGRAVKLVAADTAGAGAVARLETFAQHLGAEWAVADSAETILQSIEAGYLTVIDTAGFDPRSAKARTAYAALARLPEIEALGVVSATGDAEEVSEIAAALVTLGAARLIATGLDVTRRLGSLLAAATHGAALAHVTRSPFVSGGLETLTSLSLSRLLIAPKADRGSPQ
jgi:flagellar biosynthesis protein FlhF